MSKKQKNFNISSSQYDQSHAAEYLIIRNDLIRLVVLNTIFLVGMLALYYTNSRSHYLEQWFKFLF